MSYLTRLEPRSRSASLDVSLAARIADPAWMLARQWQLGELLGDDASTPVHTEHRVEVRPLTGWHPAGRDPEPYDPGSSPLEALAEAQPPVWTARRAVDVGRELLRRLSPADRAAVLAAFPLAAASPSPLPDPAGERLRALASGRVPDGAAAHTALAPGLDAEPPHLDLPPGTSLADPAAALTAATEWLGWCRAVGLVPARATRPTWLADRHEHSFVVEAMADIDTVELIAEEHPGGRVDWPSFDARTEPRGDPARPAKVVGSASIPVPATFHGMPDPRWWAFEEGTLDLGKVDANPADLVRLAILEFALVYGNDFFVAPVRLPFGTLSRVESLLVTDNMGITTRVRPMATTGPDRVPQGAARWTMYTLTNLDGGVSDHMLLAPVTAQQLTSPPTERVLMLRDEMANLAWAVEQRYEGDTGRPVDRAEQNTTPLTPGPAPTSGLRYRLGTTVPPNWYPLVPSAGAEGPVLTVTPMAFGAAGSPAGTLLRIGDVVQDEEVPREGLRLWRERVMTRWSDGTAVLWERNRSGVGRGEGSSGLRFDVATTEEP